MRTLLLLAVLVLGGCAPCAGWLMRGYGEPHPHYRPACEVLSRQLFVSPDGERLWFTNLGYVERYPDPARSDAERIPYSCKKKTLTIRGETVPWTPDQRIEWSGIVWTLHMQF
jgi:hypothetical protein